MLPAELPQDVPVDPYMTDQAYWKTVITSYSIHYTKLYEDVKMLCIGEMLGFLVVDV